MSDQRKVAAERSNVLAHVGSMFARSNIRRAAPTV